MSDPSAQSHTNESRRVVSEVESLRAELEARDREIERAYQMLEMFGVPRDRAKSVANGIDVLRTRMDREIQTWKDTVRDRTYELSQAKREIAELRANLAQAEYDNWYKPQEGEE